jgi:group II intron reverse transcriptase/maturase
MQVTELREWFSQNWRTFSESLKGGRYLPQAVRGVEIPKSSGGVRQLGIPTVKDRVVQQAIHQLLSPLYEAVFSEHSYGFRPKRSAHDALKEACEFVEKGKRYIVDMDLSKFFDEVNHDRLMWLLSRRIGDKRVLKLIHRFLLSGLFQGGLETQRVKGTPQGGPLSPLLSNIVLDELDKELELRGHSFVRYADDFLIFVGSQRAAERVAESVKRYVETVLRLKVNESKSRICRPWELNFLGHGILNQGTLTLSKESERRVKEAIRKLTRRNRGRSFNQVIRELNQKLVGWLHYFRYARMKGKLRHLVSWLRRKLRCYRLKQAKRAVGMMRFLHKCGVPKDRAWMTAGTRKGWWPKALCPGAHEGMNTNWFFQQGLADFEKLYLRLHT